MNWCRTAPLMLGLLLLVASCGGSGDPTVDGRSPAGSEPTAGSTTGGGEADLVGTLGGDAQLEGGCAWLESEAEGRVEPRWPEGYRIAFDPVRLLGPDGEVVAEAGDTVRVNGAVADDVMTICQIGPVFDVTEVLTPGS